MLSAAFDRAFRAVPPRSVSDLRPRTGVRVYYCFLPECTACKAFAPRKARFERDVWGEQVKALPWDCSDDRKKAIALKHDVDDLPCYLVVPCRGKVTIQQVE